MIVQRYSRRYMRRRPGRTMLSVSGIAIGVAAIFGISLTIGTTRNAYQRMFSELAGRAELEIVASGYGAFDGDLTRLMANAPGVAAAVPVAVAAAALTSAGGWSAIQVLGVDPSRDGLVRDYRFYRGRMFTDGNEVVIPVALADRTGVKVGDALGVMGSAGSVSLRVSGLLEGGGAAAFNGGAVAFTSLAAAQRLNGGAVGITSIQVVVERDARPEEVQRSLQSIVPAGMLVQTPAARAALGEAALFGTERGLGVLSVVSLVAGAFVILNSFLMGLSERTRSFALMRALGMTRSQVVRMLMGEAALVGAIGAVVGMGLGMALSVVLNAIVAGVLGAALPPIRLTWPPVALSVLLGPGVAVAATALPARRFSVRSPLELLGDRRAAGLTERPSAWLPGAGLACLLFPILVTAALVWNRVGSERLVSLLAPAMASGLIGAALLVPGIFAWLCRPLERGLTRVAGTEGRLAIRDLRRHRIRSSLTIAVLAICVVVSFGFGNSMMISVDDVRQWVDHVTPYDYFARRLWPDVGTMSAPTMPESLEGVLRSLESVDVVDKLCWAATRVNGVVVMSEIGSYSGAGPIAQEVAEGDAAGLYERLESGEVALGSVLAKKLNVRPGQTVTVQTRAGQRPMRVAGIISSYTGGGMTLHLAWPVGVDTLGVSGVHVWMLRAAPGRRQALSDALRRLGVEHGFHVQSMEQFRATVDGAMSGVVAALWVIIAFVFVVASLGTVNTLTMNVIEQMRQLGLMRAVAMTRRQVRRMIVSAAAAMALTSLVPGVAMGFLLAFAMGASHHAVTGYHVDMTIHYSLLAVTVIGAVATAVAAALVPAQRAASMPIIEAIRYE
ncbi:MAG: ABC transporter permease [Phycisphaerales bacterium]|nr:MAG: ABC transporter permease [Phycisphaerales bacterium]